MLWGNARLGCFGLAVAEVQATGADVALGVRRYTPAMTPRLEIDVDRNSVAMGDDVESHAHRITVAVGTPLSAVLAEAAPNIGSQGWSWVAHADGRAVAVWSIDHGVAMLVDDVPVTESNVPRRIFYRYFLQTYTTTGWRGSTCADRGGRWRGATP